MVVIERRPELNNRSASETELCVERTDISFHDLAGDQVRIAVTVHNNGEHRSRPTPMTLQSAPFGAFVSWRPLGQLLVPALEPGESRDLSIGVARPRPVPLGDFNGVPPRKLLAAATSTDQPSPPGAGVTSLLNLFRRKRTIRSPRPGSIGRALLAPDLWDLIGRGQPHWAGNINVFVGNRPVERHLARALRVYPGRTNLAMFLVGSPGTRDAFAFELVGLDADWEAALYDGTNHRSLAFGSSEDAIRETEWVDSNGGLIIMLATRPPAGCQTGNLEVHVTRRSSGKTALVEFNLDPSAQGAGCYTV